MARCVGTRTPMNLSPSPYSPLPVLNQAREPARFPCAACASSRVSAARPGPGAIASIPAALVLRAGKRDFTFGAEHIGIEARNPLPSARGLVEITYLSLNMRRHAVPVELRVAIDDVGG